MSGTSVVLLSLLAKLMLKCCRWLVRIAANPEKWMQMKQERGGGTLGSL